MPDKNKTHDAFFKVTFSNKAIAAGYLRQFVDKKLLKKLDLSNLKLSNNSYTLKPYIKSQEESDKKVKQFFEIRKEKQKSIS